MLAENSRTNFCFLPSGKFSKVSAKRPCRICHKTDYCGFSRDERTTICMRVSEGARRRSRNRGWIHVHDDVPAAFNYSAPVRPAAKRALIEVRDAIYRELIRISPATRYRNQLIEGPD
jgi:hypothetical protein